MMDPPESLGPLPMYIGGEWVRTAEQQTVSLPYDGSQVGACYKADAATAERAIEQARQGARAMRRLANYERAELLDRIRAILKRDLEECAGLIAAETGKPIREARIEAERTLQTLIASAEVARNFRGEVVPIDGAPIGKGRMAMTVREPLGVIAAITPFNVPLNLAMHKVGPAFAAGNAVVHKPATATPLSALRFAHIADAFLDQFAAATAKLRIGHPFEESTDISSLISEQEGMRVESWIEGARRSGARLVCGGARRRATVAPTILAEFPCSAPTTCPTAASKRAGPGARVLSMPPKRCQKSRSFAGGFEPCSYFSTRQTRTRFAKPGAGAS